MRPVPIGGEVTGSALRDLVRFNRWLCVTRLRAVGGVLAFALVLRALGIDTLSLGPVIAVCLSLAAVSWLGLRTPILEGAPRTFFYLQSLADLGGVTVGIGAAAHGIDALLFRSLYAMVIVPASLISVPSGLAMATVAALGHEGLLAYDRGLSVATLASVESLCPTFLFFLLAQQCFFYGAHLERKNTTLAELADRLGAEARMSAALLDVARTLSATLEAPELLASLNATTCARLGADWGGTFLVDVEQETFRLAAVSDGDLASTELARMELPIRGWPAVERLVREPVVVLTGVDAERTPALFAGGRRLTTVVLAALSREARLVGFLAVGFVTLSGREREQAVELLAGIGQHATIVLRNARLLEEVRRASAMKSEFVGAISHELRSPLNVILGYLDMLRDETLGPLTGGQVRALDRTRQQALALLEMITALLDMNRLEAGRLPVQRVPVSVRDLLVEVCQQIPESWRRPDVRLEVDVTAGIPPIETDPGKLKTVIRNLVHNALKFTARGAVTLDARLGTEGAVVVRVADTGCGIPPDALGYVFDMFRQVPGSDGGGVGLGLYLVRRLLEVLGGTISVASEVGRGTVFTIALPAPPVGAARAGEPVGRAA